MKYLWMLMALCLIGVQPARAQIEIYEFDKAHTQILFFVDHIGFSKSQGEFHEYEGGFTFNRADPENSKVEVSIQTSSIDMDDEKWNKHMKNSDFFDVEKFPTMSFKSTKIKKTGDKTGTITGDLTILETTKPVTLDVVFNKAAVHPFNQKYVAGFSAKAKIKRSEFGMKYGLPLLGDEVDIMIEVEGFRQNGEIFNN